MAFPSVSNTFTNGTTADATQVNTNFTDLINGLSDGTKDLNISAITAAGTATFNGSVVLGNASSDDLTIGASLASSIAIKTQGTYNFGSATLGLLSLYIAGTSTFTTRLLSAATASWSFTFPPTTGVKGQGMVNNASGAMIWGPAQFDTNAVSSADYTVLDDDGYAAILLTTGNTSRTVNLPTAADNTDRVLFIKKVDTGTGSVLINGENSETVDGSASNYGLYGAAQSVCIKCDGTGWHVIAANTVGKWTSYTPTFSALGSVSSISFAYRVVGENLEVRGDFTTGTTTASAAEIYLPTGFTVTNQSSSGVHPVGFLYQTGVSARPELVVVATNADTFVGLGDNNGNVGTVSALTEINGNTLSSSDRKGLHFSVRIA